MFTSPRDTVTLVAGGAAQNGEVRLGLRFQLAPGWHIYWSNPGDAGLAPQIMLDAPALAGPFTYPPPELLVQDSVADYVLSGDVLLPFTARGVTKIVSAHANWLVCSDVCVPEHASFLLPLGGAPAAFPAAAVVPSPFPARIAPDGTLSITGPGAAQVRAARFFPSGSNEIINREAQSLRFFPGGLALHLHLAPGFKTGDDLPGVLELTDKSGAMQALAVTATPGPAPAAVSLGVWLGFAFLGGLILNLMPCVFPILAMKALSLARLGGAHRAEVRREALGYTAGVLVAMLGLAAVLLTLRAAGEAVGWGFQLQSPVFVVLIAWLIFAAGLNLAGAFEVPAASRWGRFFNRRGGFFTGLLAVVVATPCTAPFMGGAIAAALAAPPAAAAGIFICLGLGLAAPFLLLGLVPAAARILPRPGRWMMALQRGLAIPMFCTFAWLAWVASRQAGEAGLGLLLLGAAVIGLALTVKPLRLAAFAVVFLLPFLHATATVPALQLPGSEPFSTARLAALQAAGQPVFLDMTASWCVTCLVNDRTTLTAPAVRNAFAARHVQLLVGDWTNRDDAITAFLQANHRDGVPLYVYLPPGGAAMTLPQILSPGLVLAALGPAS